MRIILARRDVTNLMILAVVCVTVALLWIIGFYGTLWMHAHQDLVGRTDAADWFNPACVFFGLVIIFVCACVLGGAVLVVVGTIFLSAKFVWWVWPRQIKEE